MSQSSDGALRIKMLSVFLQVPFDVFPNSVFSI